MLSSREASRRRISTSLGAVAVSFALYAANPLAAQGEIVRAQTPESWFHGWSDDRDNDKLDDRFDTLGNGPWAIVVNYLRCVSDDDLRAIRNLGGGIEIQRRLKYITSVAVDGATRADLLAIAAMEGVAFIELQEEFHTLLDTSLPTICREPGPCSPDTVREAFPNLDGAGINIVVMDTGVDDPGGPGVTHQGFPVAVAGYDALTQSFVNPDDLHGHGTHVASIALGRATAGTDAGVAPAANLIDVRVLGGNGGGTWAQVVDGLETVYDNRAAWNVHVINMSLGSGTSAGDDSLSQLVDLAEAMGIVVVVAAGNDGPANPGIPRPAAASRSIAVAAADDNGDAHRANDDIANFSNRGPRDDDGDADQRDELKPDVAAPGVRIDAAAFNTLFGSARRSGTSMATPHVSGLAALIRQANPNINAASVKDLIIATAERRGTATLPGIDPEWNDSWGFGLIDAGRALGVAQDTDLTFPSHPASPGWASADIATNPFPPRQNQQTTITARIRNNGPAMATGVRIHFGVHVYSASIPTFHDIGTVVVDVPVDPTGFTAVSVPWVPADVSHQCLKVEIGFGPDTDYSNNVAQRNVNVQRSPVTFQVQNTVTEAPVPIRLVAELEREAPGWDLEMSLDEIVLGADDCPVDVDVELIPPPNARPGDVRRVHVASIADTEEGPIELGGITAVSRVPFETNEVYINCGGPDFEDEEGRRWWGDTDELPSPFLRTLETNVVDFGNPDDVDVQSDATVEAARFPAEIFTRERWSDGPIEYVIGGLELGDYSVTLLFMEACCSEGCEDIDDPALSGGNCRVLDIYLNDQLVEDQFAQNVEAARLTGVPPGIDANRIAIARTYEVVEVDNVRIRINDLGGGNPPENASIKGIAIVPAGAVGALLKPGDVNFDGAVNISDPVAALSHMFGGQLLPGCYAEVDGAGVATLTEAGRQVLDWNGDGAHNISDAVASLNFQFGGGARHALGSACLRLTGTCTDNCQ